MDFTPPTGDRRISVRVRDSSHAFELQHHIIRNYQDPEELMQGLRLVAATANCCEGAIALTIHLASMRRAKSTLLAHAMHSIFRCK